MPFTDQPGTRLQSEPGIRSDPPLGPEHLRQCLEFASCRFAEPAVMEFLTAITDPSHQQIATELWRCVVIQPAPFSVEIREACGLRHCLRGMLSGPVCTIVGEAMGLGSPWFTS